jgi:hypothetical protein
MTATAFASSLSPSLPKLRRFAAFDSDLVPLCIDNCSTASITNSLRDVVGVSIPIKARIEGFTGGAALVTAKKCTMEFVVVPVGIIFGSCSSPSFWQILAELRSHLADVENLSAFPAALAEKIILPPPPTAAGITSFAPAVADSCHEGVPLYRALWHHNSMFVDHNGVVGIRARIIQAIRNSIASAFLIFGIPEEDHQAAALPSTSGLTRPPIHLTILVMASVLGRSPLAVPSPNANSCSIYCARSCPLDRVSPSDITPVIP